MLQAKTKYNPKNSPLTDDSNLTPIFADDLACIHELGPVTHLVLAASQCDRQGRGERLVVLRLIIPSEMRLPLARQLMAGVADPELVTADDQVEETAVH